MSEDDRKGKPPPKDVPKAALDKGKADSRESPFQQPKMQVLHGSQDRPRSRGRKSDLET